MVNRIWSVHVPSYNITRTTDCLVTSPCCILYNGYVFHQVTTRTLTSPTIAQILDTKMTAGKLESIHLQTCASEEEKHAQL